MGGMCYCSPIRIIRIPYPISHISSSSVLLYVSVLITACVGVGVCGDFVGVSVSMGTTNLVDGVVVGDMAEIDVVGIFVVVGETVLFQISIRKKKLFI